MATRTITRLYDTYDEATRAVQALEAAGVPHNDISLVGSAHDRAAEGAGDTATSAAATGAGTGATLGTLVGGGAVERMSRHDTNPANNLAVPAEHRS